MGIWNWFAERREHSRVAALLGEGHYDEAAATADRGRVDRDLAKTAHEKLTIAQAVRNCAAGNLAAELQPKIDSVCNRIMQGSGVISGWQARAARARVRSLLREGKNGDATELAIRIPDAEIRAQSLRCIAAAVAAERPAEARTVVAAMTNLRNRQEELRYLCLSRLILRDFKTAHDIAEATSARTEGELSTLLHHAEKAGLVELVLTDPPKVECKDVVYFVEKYHTHPDDAGEATLDSSVEYQLPMALLYCVLGKIKQAAETLNQYPMLSMQHGRLQQGLFATIATSLAYADQRDQARQFLAGYSGPVLFEAEAHLLGHFAYPTHTYRELATRVDRGEIAENSPADCGSVLGRLALELVAMQEANEASAMVAALSNAETRRVTTAQVVDFVYAVLHGE